MPATAMGALTELRPCQPLVWLPSQADTGNFITRLLFESSTDLATWTVYPEGKMHATTLPVSAVSLAGSSSSAGERMVTHNDALARHRKRELRIDAPYRTPTCDDVVLLKTSNAAQASIAQLTPSQFASVSVLHIVRNPFDAIMRELNAERHPVFAPSLPFRASDGLVEDIQDPPTTATSVFEQERLQAVVRPVSYTHLTLPTILLV